MNGKPPDFLLSTLSRLGRKRSVEAGAVLFRRGETPAFLFWVLDGELNLVRTTAAGGSAVLQRCTQGPLAEASPFSERYHCDGVAGADTTLIAIPKKQFLQAFAEPDFARAYVQWLSGTVRGLRSSCERLGLRRAPSRVEHYLDEYGCYDFGPGQANLKDWAAELGLTHESLYRTLATMEADGRIVRDAGCIRLAH